MYAEAAGEIDHETKIVRISAQPSIPVRRFTTAHELGHAALHPGLTLHRDLPIRGPTATKNWREREANWFASAFLMPRRRLISAFLAAFEFAPFYLNDDSAFALCSTRAETVLAKLSGIRGLSRLLADANRYGGREIPRLTAMFGVSTDAMAIRLEQLGLVK